MKTAASVLVVEDNAGARDVLCDLLRVLDYRVATAANGRDALALLAKHSFDAVVLDLGLPDITDGLEVSRIASGHRVAPAVIAFSGFHQLEEAATAAGCSAFIPKPDLDNLLASLAAAIRTREAAP